MKGEIKKAQVETRQEITKQYQAILRGEIKKVHIETKQEITKQVKYHFEDVHNHVLFLSRSSCLPLN